MQKHLWLQVYLWVHLRAEEGEQDNFVPPSELVPLPTGHLEHLIPNHHPLDENGGREAEGLTQDAVCRKGGTAELTVSVWVRSPAPSGVICWGTDIYGDQLMKKEPGKGQMFPVAGPVRCWISYSCFKPQRARVNSQQDVRTKHGGVIQLQRVTGQMLDGSALEVKASDLWFERLHGFGVSEQEGEEPKGRWSIITLKKKNKKQRNTQL